MVLLLMHYYTSLHFPKREKKKPFSPLLSFCCHDPDCICVYSTFGGRRRGVDVFSFRPSSSSRFPSRQKKEWCRGGIPGGQISASLHRLKAEGGRNPNGVIGSGIRQTFGTISPNESWETTGSFIHFSENTNCVESHTNQGVVTPLSPSSRGELGGGCNRSSSLPLFPPPEIISA